MSEKTHLQVQGMTCMDCAKTISTFLQSRDAKQVSVDFVSGEVSFEAVEKTKEAELVSGINQLGYRVMETQATESRKGDVVLLMIWVLTFPLLLSHLLNIKAVMHQPLLQFLLSFPVSLFGVLHFGKSAIGSVRLRQPNMDVLIVTGVLAAFVYSCAGWLLYAGEAHQYLYFETGASIVAFVMLGQRIEKYSINKANAGVKELSERFPEKAHRLSLQFGKQVREEIPVHDIRKFDLLQVLTGEKIPADGEVVDGSGYADESLVTGESVPVAKKAGDKVVTGSQLESGTLVIRSSGAYAHNSLHTLLGLIKDARMKKPAIQKTGDKVAGIFVVAVILISVLAFPVNYLLGAGLSEAALRSIAVLVVSCPCAMGLATPVAMMVGVGLAAKRGIVLRNGEAIEHISRTKQVVFDKTGTLTTGKFVLSPLSILDPLFDEKQAKNILYTLESVSIHPIARSVSASLAASSELLVMSECTEEKGKGVKGKISGTWYSVEGIDREGRKWLLLSCEGKAIAEAEVEDQERTGTVVLLQWLKQRGIRLFLMSGDKEQRVKQFASGKPFHLVEWELKPEDKLNRLRELSKAGVVAMAGDGLNDAPALALAHTGIGYGDPGTIHADTSDVLLLHPDKAKAFRRLFELSTVVMRTIRQNLFWAFSYNLIAIPLALTGHMEPMYAALFMSLSDLVVVGNSLFIYAKAPK